MKKDSIYKLFIALFLCLCLLPLAAMPVVGESEPAANELPVTRPELWDGGLNIDYPSQMSDYVASRFAFRGELVTAWSALNAALLRTSAQEQLILGRDGWLFFSETLDDYMGLGLSDVLLQSAANNLALMQEYVESRGADLVFTVAPNKNSLYPQFMPRRYAEGSESSNAVRLGALLRERGVRYADLFSAFEGCEPLYFAGDSHWTSQGAALAADCILACAGRESGYFDSGFSPGEEHLGDLYEMLYPALPANERDLTPALSFGYECLGDPAGGNAMNISTENASASGSLLCYRDSFGVALYPYLAQSYGEARFSRAAVYDLCSAGDADTVVIELVERNIEYLVDYAPRFPAPERDIEAEGFGQDGVSVEYTEAADGLVQLSGQLPEGLCDEGGRLFLRVGGRVLEACVLRGAEGQGPRFSLWTEGESRAEALLCYKAGQLTEYSIISD